MNCKNCGQELGQNVRFCPKYESKVESEYVNLFAGNQALNSTNENIHSNILTNGEALIKPTKVSKKAIITVVCVVVAALITCIIAFAVSGNSLEKTLIGTWSSPGDDSLLTIRGDGTCGDPDSSTIYSWRLDEDILTIYKESNNKVVSQFIVEVISNDSLVFTSTKNGEERYADRVK